NLSRWNTHIAHFAFNTKSARWQLEIFVHCRTAQVDRFDGRSKPEADVYDVGAGRKNDRRRWCLVFLQEFEISVRIGFGAVDTPGQTTTNRRRILAEMRAQRQRHLPQWDYRNRCSRVA